MIITIDGPAGSGKSTIAKKVAERLNFEFFDTGAIYRSVTWYLLESKVNIKDEGEIKKSLQSFIFEIEDTKERKYLVNGQDVTKFIRMHEVTENVSEVSTYAAVRKHVLEIQRNFGRKKSAVFEGRDMGTVVFPYADVKFFLTANPKIRAERRYTELMEKFPELAHTYDYDKILSEIITRDKIDSTRKLSPLKKAKDGYLIDTSKMSIEVVLEKIEKRIKKYNKRKNIPIPYFFQMHLFYGSILFIVWLFFKFFYRLKVHGINNFIKGPGIIASNHVSNYDPPAIAVSSMEEIHFLAKESLFNNPLFGFLIKKLNAHPLSRGASDIGSFKKVLSLLNQGKKIILFPEGERSQDGKLMKIMPGIGLLVYLSKCSVIPTYIHGSYEIWNRTKRRPKMFGKIHVVFGTPISFAECDHLDKKACMDRVNNLLERALFQLQGWCEGGFKGTPP
jgi:cytidylate kinase